MIISAVLINILLVLLMYMSFNRKRYTGFPVAFSGPTYEEVEALKSAQDAMKKDIEKQEKRQRAIEIRLRNLEDKARQAEVVLDYYEPLRQELTAKLKELEELKAVYCNFTAPAQGCATAGETFNGTVYNRQIDSIKKQIFQADSKLIKAYQAIDNYNNEIMQLDVA